MDEDESLATISIIFFVMIGIMFVIASWLRCRRNENGFEDIDF